jgi:hypothetical protein
VLRVKKYSGGPKMSPCEMWSTPGGPRITPTSTRILTLVLEFFWGGDLVVCVES